MKNHFIALTGAFKDLPIPEGAKPGDEVKFKIDYADQGENSFMTFDVYSVSLAGDETPKASTVETELREIITAKLRDEMGWKACGFAADIAADIASCISPHEEMGSLAQLGLASRKYIAAVDLIGHAVRASGLGSAGDNIFDVAEKMMSGEGEPESKTVEQRKTLKMNHCIHLEQPNVSGYFRNDNGSVMYPLAPLDKPSMK